MKDSIMNKALIDFAFSDEPFITFACLWSANSSVKVYIESS